MWLYEVYHVWLGLKYTSSNIAISTFYWNFIYVFIFVKGFRVDLRFLPIAGLDRSSVSKHTLRRLAFTGVTPVTWSKHARLLLTWWLRLCRCRRLSSDAVITFTRRRGGSGPAVRAGTGQPHTRCKSISVERPCAPRPRRAASSVALLFRTLGLQINPVYTIIS